VRFNEIASPEDQLALWKLVSDTMWGAFAQELSPSPMTLTQPRSVGQGGAAIPIQPIAKQVPKAPAQAAHKAQPKAKGRAIKPKRTPTAPAPKPKPLPKPNPQQPSPIQAPKQQTQQHQQLPQHLHKEMNKSSPQQRIYPQPPTPMQKAVTPIEPMTNGYEERDKDELVTHARAQHPFKTAGQIKSALPGQKRGF
jgi:hypothetical protein